jgi:hypothetical protein
MCQLLAAPLCRRATLPSGTRQRQHVPAFVRRIWGDVSRFAVVAARPMIALLSIVSGRVCLAWMIMAGSGMAGAQPWQPRDLEPLPAATGLTRADEAARQPNRRDRAHHLRALRRLQPNSNRTSEAANAAPAFARLPLRGVARKYSRVLMARRLGDRVYPTTSAASRVWISYRLNPSNLRS